MRKEFAVRTCSQFLVTSIAILLIGSLPYLLFNMKSQLDVLKMIDQKTLSNTLFLYDTIVLNFEAYVTHIGHTLKLLFSGETIEYYARGRQLPLFPDFLKTYILSMVYFLASLGIATVLAMLLTIMTMSLPIHRRILPKAVLFIVESLPDIFVILLTQITIIWIYQRSGFLLFNVTNGFDEQAIMLPVLVLSLLPSVYIYKYLLLSFEEEEKQLYVELARGKGLSRGRILLVHIFRNSILTLFNHMKGIILFVLSNLLMLEIIFDVPGFMTFIYENGVLNPMIVTVALYMVFIPSFILYTASQWALNRFVLPGDSL